MASFTATLCKKGGQHNVWKRSEPSDGLLAYVTMVTGRLSSKDELSYSKTYWYRVFGVDSVRLVEVFQVVL